MNILDMFYIGIQQCIITEWCRKTRSLLNLKLFFFRRWVTGLAYYMCVFLWVCLFVISSLGTDQWPLPVLQLSCNYSAVCDIWVFKRSNTVSILSQGTDVRRVSAAIKGHLLGFDATQYFSLCFLCLHFFSLFSYFSSMWNAPGKCQSGIQKWLLSRGQQVGKHKKVKQAW